MTVSILILAVFFGFAQSVSIDTRDMDLSDFFRLMANIGNMNVVLHPAVQGKVNLMVKDAPWNEVLDVVLKTHGLEKEVEGNTMRIAPAAAFEAEQKQRAAIEEACFNALPLGTRTYVLNYAKADSVAAVLSKMLSRRGSVIIYPPRNAVIVRDVEQTAECVR